MTIQELRQHQIVVQDPEIDRSEYDAVMGRLRELGEVINPYDSVEPRKHILCLTSWLSWLAVPSGPTLTFDQFMNLQIETE